MEGVERTVDTESPNEAGLAWRRARFGFSHRRLATHLKIPVGRSRLGDEHLSFDYVQLRYHLGSWRQASLGHAHTASIILTTECRIAIFLVSVCLPAGDSSQLSICLS
ncbi:unnamed protein product [Protopolystoma xenopodis]|uniref:Uncharacterized protein n=1 Tax=Protopolystoma xenopodis TaxID=117903 RepID=A0A3S5CL97_9PLAT|nr:unnamed protein product [Protopolystoma xenopodis]